MHCDLNCDLGEGIGNDALILPHISSANIACGFHAGNLEIMKDTVALCLQHKVAIGAHPSYPDKENFGRIDMLGKSVQQRDLPQIILDQLNVLLQVCKQHDTTLHHVKLHGALYNRAAIDKEVSMLICSTIASFDPKLIVYGLSGSQMSSAAKACSLSYQNEVFADRTYSDDGTLTPRSKANALIEDEEEALKQVLLLVKENKVKSLSGDMISIKAETICLHGDGKHAVAFAKKIRSTLIEEGIDIKAI
jgi:UPF0271 protein